MRINLWFLLLIWTNLVALCMAGCAITPDENGHVTIPDDWEKLVNGAIPSSAFYQCSALQSVIISDSVTSIGDYAFQSCSALQSVTIPDSVTSIGSEAFRSCYALQSVTIPDSVTSIGKKAFEYCTSLASVTIGDSVTSISAKAFLGCTSLASVTIGDSVTYIGSYAFYQCTSLASVTIPDSVASIGYQAFYLCTSLASVTIGDSLISIERNVFYQCTSLASVSIPDSVTSIGDSAFWGCNSLASVTIGDSVTSIGDSAFWGCNSLASVTIGDSVTSISAKAFFQCKVTSLTVTGSVNPGTATFASLLTSHQGFDPTKVTSVTVDGTSTSIRDGDFSTFTGIEQLTFEASANDTSLSIGSGAFSKSCALEEMDVKRSNISMAADSFDFTCTSSRFNTFTSYIKNIYAPGFSDVLACSSSDEKCGCAVPGMGSDLGEDSSYFNCVAKCAAGKYANGSGYDNGMCHPCPADTYSKLIGAPACSPCESDMSMEGACGDGCPLGTHIVNGTDCAFCDAGKYSDEKGMFDCTSCPLGKYSNETGGVSITTCIDCQAGRYTEAEATVECTLCSAAKSTSGKTGSTKSTMCTICEAGRYSPTDGTASCLPCAIGMYAEAEKSACSLCEGNLTTIEGNGRAITDCFKDCPIGQASAGTTTTCTSCGSGTYNDATGQKECSLCPAGRFVREQGKSGCDECPPGSYAETEGSPVCALCPGGKSSSVVAAIDSSSCEQCQLGYYSFSGMTACRMTPPGSYVAIVGANDSTLCPAGRYQSESGQSTCEQTQEGKYASKGAAIALSCPPGTYSTAVGAESKDTCLDCSDGTYSQLGASACIVCGKDFISNADHSACVTDPESLAQESLVSSLFSKGAALYGTFIVAAGFVALASILSFKREKYPDSLSQLPRFQVLVKSFLPGFTFGSELFLIVGIIGTEPEVASVMIIFRLLHLVVGAITTTALWSPSSVSGGRFDSVLKGASSLRSHLDEDFARENMPFIGVLTLMSFLDSTMVQFMPWKKSRFNTESKGFPSLGLLKCVLLTKVVQGGVSAICQVSFLLTSSDLGGATVSAQAKALFIMNILFSIGGVVLGLLLLGIKGELLSKIDDTTTDSSCSDSDSTGRKQSSVFELADIHTSSDITIMNNPMHNIEEGAILAAAMEKMKTQEMKAGEVNLAAENIVLKDKITNLEQESQCIKETRSDMEAQLANKTQENNGLKTTITDLKTENSILREEMKELKRKFEDDKSVDL